MRASRGEIKIEEILKREGIKFVCEYTFPDLLTNKGSPLRFDFAVFDDDGDLDFLIEYQGKQHYEPSAKFGGLAGLKRQMFNDTKKIAYCQKHGIKLILIPYTDENVITFDYIMRAAGY